MRPDLVACWVHRVVDGRVEILMIRRAPDRLYPGLWQCPTGRLEDGEGIVAGALREVAEETGLAGADLDAVFEADLVNWFHEQTADGIWSEAVFAARVRFDAAPVLSDEHDDLRWCSPAEAHALVVWPAYHAAIDRVVWLVENAEQAEVYRLRS